MTTRDDILGKMCANKEYHDCIHCAGRDYRCPDYYPVDAVERKRKDYTPMILRTERKTKILPKNYQEWVRRASDSGVI